MCYSGSCMNEAKMHACIIQVIKCVSMSTIIKRKCVVFRLNFQTEVFFS